MRMLSFFLQFAATFRSALPLTFIVKSTQQFPSWPPGRNLPLSTVTLKTIGA